MIHCRPDTDECSSRPIDGSATFTIVLSSPTMNRLRQQMARMSRRRWRLRSGRTVHLDRGFRSARGFRDACAPTTIISLQSNPARRPAGAGGTGGVDHETLTSVRFRRASPRDGRQSRYSTQVRGLATILLSFRLPATKQTKVYIYAHPRTRQGGPHGEEQRDRGL